MVLGNGNKRIAYPTHNEIENKVSGLAFCCVNERQKARLIPFYFEVSWLDLQRNPQRQASFPNAHNITQLSSADKADYELSNKADGYQSWRHIFPAHSCFEYKSLNDFLSQLKVERIKGILKTNKGWFIINGIDGNIKSPPPPTNTHTFRKVHVP